ncbi:MAG: efflux RND transporter periplasmic adaptor subunit [Planctomycetes bacterium]|nr:efflux RND transporter periplasmic adaptor subunit [Planctomycetota bacterium]
MIEASPRPGWNVGAWAFIFALAPVYLAGCGGGKPAESAAGKAPRQYIVRTDTVKTQSVRYELETTGTIQAQDVYRIDAQVTGTIYEVGFKEGDFVQRGTVLCRIAPLGYKLAALKAEGEYKKAVADLADTERRVKNGILNAEVSLREAEIEVTRRRTVRAAGAISEEEVQLYQAKRDLAEIQLKDMKDAAQTMVDVMRTAILEKEAAMKIAQDDLRKSTVLPPMDGQIEQKMVTNGNFVQSGTPLAVLVDLGALKLKFTLPEDQAPHVKSGAEVSFRVPAYPDRDLKATVYYVGDLADQTTRLVTCWAMVQKSDANLKGGFFATIRIVTNEKKQAIVIPMTALLPTEYGFVSFVVQDGKAVRRKVETGLHVVDRAVEILSGLKEGEAIVVEGANSLQDGVPVKVLANVPVDAKSDVKPQAQESGDAKTNEQGTSKPAGKSVP